MPVHINPKNDRQVLDANGKLVPGGNHKTHAQALAHERAMNINMRREEGKPVAPKQKGIRLPNGEFDAQKRDVEPNVGGGVDVDKLPASDFVDPEGRRFPIKIAKDVTDAVSSYGRANPKIPFETFKRRLTAIANRKGFGSSLPEEWKHEQKSPVDEQDPLGYVGEDYRDAPKPREASARKASFIADPTDDDLYVWLNNDDINPYLGGGLGFTKSDDKAVSQQPSPPYVDMEQGDMLTDRAFYHHSPERYEYHPSPDWNDDTSFLPDAWLRAHPYGNPYSKDGKDAHQEYFDQKTNFYEKDKLLPQVPVTYYHNYTPDGEPMGEPTAIGKTIARKYTETGRWDKVRFNKDMDPEIKARLAKAMRDGSLRSSPTVVPDFHKVNDRTGHIDNWLTGSIAVLDAHGERQPASPKAIGIPAMKALFKEARIQFPKQLEVNSMGTQANVTKGAPRFSKARSLLKALYKALGEDDQPVNAQTKGRMKAEADPLYHEHPGMADGEGHSHDGGDKEHEHSEEEMKALFEDSNPEDSAKVPYGLGNTYWWERYTGPQTDRDRYDGGTNFQKGVQPLAQEVANIEAEEEAEEAGKNPLKDQDVELDWTPQQKAMKMMKAQISQLQRKTDEGDFNQWFSGELQAGRTLPAERPELYAGYMQALADDRRMHPLMKAKNGAPVSRVAIYQLSIARRQPIFGEAKLTADQMKAMGFVGAGFAQPDETDEAKKFTPQRREQLLGVSAVGAKILQDEKKK